MSAKMKSVYGSNLARDWICIQGDLEVSDGTSTTDAFYEKHEMARAKSEKEVSTRLLSSGGEKEELDACLEAIPSSSSIIWL